MNESRYASDGIVRERSISICENDTSPVNAVGEQGLLGGACSCSCLELLELADLRLEPEFVRFCAAMSSLTPASFWLWRNQKPKRRTSTTAPADDQCA